MGRGLIKFISKPVLLPAGLLFYVDVPDASEDQIEREFEQLLLTIEQKRGIAPLRITALPRKGPISRARAYPAEPLPSVRLSLFPRSPYAMEELAAEFIGSLAVAELFVGGQPVQIGSVYGGEAEFAAAGSHALAWLAPGVLVSSGDLAGRMHLVESEPWGISWAASGAGFTRGELIEVGERFSAIALDATAVGYSFVSLHEEFPQNGCFDAHSEFAQIEIVGRVDELVCGPYPWQKLTDVQLARVPMLTKSLSARNELRFGPFDDWWPSSPTFATSRKEAIDALSPLLRYRRR